MAPSLKVDGATVILVGSFNPAIFHPIWFARAGLIRDEEADKAENLVVTPEVASFTADWLKFEVSQERFAAHSTDAAHFEPLQDLVLGTFQLLAHTPFHMMGLNRHLHYQMESEDSWHSIGDKLAPKEVWRPLFETKPGMRSLAVQGKRFGGRGEFVLTTIQPSLRVKPYGVYIETNEHHQVEAGPGSGLALMSILQDDWTNAIAFGASVADHLFSNLLER